WPKGQKLPPPKSHVHVGLYEVPEPAIVVPRPVVGRLDEGPYHLRRHRLGGLLRELGQLHCLREVGLKVPLADEVPEEVAEVVEVLRPGNGASTRGVQPTPNVGGLQVPHFHVRADVVGEGVEDVLVGLDGHRPKMSAGSQVSCYRRSEEHTSELQSRENLVCRLLLEKK